MLPSSRLYVPSQRITATPSGKGIDTNQDNGLAVMIEQPAADADRWREVLLQLPSQVGVVELLGERGGEPVEGLSVVVDSDDDVAPLRAERRDIARQFDRIAGPRSSVALKSRCDASASSPNS